jgi:hypothetical protein
VIVFVRSFVRFVVLLALLFAPSAAKPAEERGIKKVISRAELPGGLVLEVEPGSLAVRRGALAAPLPVLDRAVSPRALKGVAMESDGSGERGNPRALFARGKLGVVVGRDGIRALRGDDELGATVNPGAEQIRAAIHLADANVVFLRWGRGGREGCEASDPQGALVLPLRGAANGQPSGR